MNWKIDRTSGAAPIELPLEPGDRVFVVGPNGSGKSALIQQFVSSNRSTKVRRIVAHRPTGFRSERPNFIFQDRIQAEREIQSREYNVDSRWRDDQNLGHEMQSIVLSDLREKESAQARLVRDRIRKEDIAGARHASQPSESPIGQINGLFKVGNLPVSLNITDTGDTIACHRRLGATYSIAHMSDGERNAAIIGATVLTVEPGTILLIDEPERHLHRSIIEPFLTALFQQRQDCVFIVSTHDTELASVDMSARVLMVRSCEWQGNTVNSWDIDVLPKNSSVPEDLRRAILGARRRMLLVEGTDGSLDVPLYSALFPEVSVVPVGSCSDVRSSVKVLRENDDLHRVQVFGLIDRDDRSKENVDILMDEGVFALEVCAAESLYYCSEAIEIVALRQGVSLGCDSVEMVRVATEGALDSLRKPGVAEQMAARRCERKIRNAVIADLPDWRMIRDGHQIAFSQGCFDLYFEEELGKLRGLVEGREYDEIVRRYSIKHSSVFGDISRALRCRNKKDYELMVVARIREDEGFAGVVREKIGTLSYAIEKSVR